jgi:hypothetical protein
MGNVHGRATAIAVMTPIKPGQTPLLKLNFWVMDNIPPVTQTLRDLELIHFARWSIIDEIPYNGPPQEPEELRYRYLFFQSNFNGSWDEYIDAFSYLLPIRMRGVWGTSFGFPGAKPVVPFKEYIQRNEYVTSHYYSAYPEATTRMITAALDLKERFDAFDQRIDGQSPEEFAAAFRDFVTDAQGLL